MIHIIVNRILLFTTANTPMRIVAITYLLISMASPVVANWNGGWNFHGVQGEFQQCFDVMPTTNDAPKYVDVGGHINTELGNAGQSLAAKGEIAGIQLDISLHKFYGDYKYSIFKPNDSLSGQRLDVSISSFVDTDGKVSNNILRCRITNHFYRYRITTRGNPVTYESFIDVGKTFVIEGFLAKINTEIIPDYFPDGNYFVQGEQYSDLYDGGFLQRLGTIEFNKLTNSSNSYSILNLTKDGTQYTGGPLGLTLKNPIIFSDQGGFIKAVDPIFVTPSSTKNGGIRIYNIASSRMVALEFMYSLPSYYYKLDYNENVWASFYENGGSSDFSCRIAPLDKIKVPVSVHDVTRIGTISTKPIATNVFFYKPNGQLVASGRSNVGGTITLDEGDVDMNETYNITLELASTDPKWPWSHRRHYANLIPAQIQPRQLALPVTLQTALREQLVRLAPLRAGAGYDLTSVWRLLTDWNPWQVQPLSITEIRKRDESLARLHIAMQQLADIYIKADELSVSMAKAVINSATAWQEMVEARQKIRTTVATSRISHSRLDRKLYGKLLEYMEDNIRNWVIEQIQESLTGRQADLFGKMLDAAISARRAYFNSNDIKNRTSEVNEAARANLISGLASDAIAKLALQQYVETTQKALDSAVVDSTVHQWSGSTGDGIMRAVPLGAFLVEQIEQPLNDADFLNNTSAGWNEIADGLGSISIGRLFFKITAGIRIITTTAQTAAVVRLFVVHDDLDNDKVSRVTRSAYHDIGATGDQLALSTAQSNEPSSNARAPRNTIQRVFTGYASALTRFEQSLNQDIAVLKAEAEIYLAADDTLDLDVQVQINRLRAMAGQAAEPRPRLTLAIGTLISKARELRDARMDLVLAMVDGSESSALGSDASDAAILAAIGNVHSSLNSLEQALSAAGNEASGLPVPAVLGVERAWIPAEREDGTVIPGAVEIRARICNRGDAPSAVAWVTLASAESYPGLHSIQTPAKNLPVLAPGQSIEVSWTAGLGELGTDNRGLIAGYSIRIGAGDSLISEFDGQIQGGNPQDKPSYAIDGFDDGFEGYLNRTVQTWPTRWSSYNALTNLRSSQSGDRLNLLIGGCASGNSMLLFIDSRAGGVNRITPGLVSGPDAAIIDNLALDGGTGLTFEQGFAADHMIRVGGIPEAIVHIANLQAPGLISAIGSSGTSPISGGFVAGVATKWNPVILDPSRFSRCERGIEISLDLMALGLQPGANRIKLFALLLNDFSTLGSNQSLPSRGVDTDIGSAVNTVNFTNESGNQMLTIDVTIETEPIDTDADGLPDAVETGTGRFVDASDTGTNPTLADSDGDGLGDLQEITISKTNPLLSDTNGNGINDALEDTDNDGILNGREINQLGTNPLLADTNSNGLSDTYELLFQGSTDPFTPRVGDRVRYDLGRLGYQGTYKLIGTLPAGLTFNATTGVIEGKLTGSAKINNLTIQVINGKTVVRSIPLSIPVLAFPTSLAGTWQALLKNDQGRPEGLITVVVSSPGNWSATYDSVGTRTLRNAKGAFDLNASEEQVSWNITVPAGKSFPSSLMSFGIDGNTAIASGTHPRGTMQGFRLARGAELPATTRTITMLIDQGDQDGMDIPAGTGWATGSISNRGAVALKGQLGDAQAITTTLSLGATGQALMWLKPYKNLNSYIGGIVSLHGSGVLPASPLHKQESELWWYRAADATELGYSTGFAPLSASVGVRSHLVPSSALALSQNLGLTEQVIRGVVFDGGGLPDPNAVAKLPEAFAIDASYKMIAAPLPGQLMAPWKGLIASRTGGFTGTLGVTANNQGTLAGNAAVSGVLFPTVGSRVVGAGLVKIPIVGPKGAFRTGAIVLGTEDQN